jgi:FkbM family methyltransferase
MLDRGLKNTITEHLRGSRVQLVDVGARDGIASRFLPFCEFLNVAAFEPDPEECARLNAKAASLPYPIRFLPQALGSVDGQRATLNICRQPGCSSLFQPNLELCNQFPYGPNLEVVKTHELELNRMDTALRGTGIQPDILKIDTQGTELDILRGAGELLRKVLVVELEVEFVPQYIDQPLFADVDQFMRSQGFELRGLKRSYWRRKIPSDWQYSARGGQLLHGDALYVNAAQLAASANDLPAALKALVALSSYAQDDLILNMLAQPGHALKHLPEATRRALAQQLTASSPPWYARLIRPLVRGYPHRRLRERLDGVRAVDATDWHDPDFF